MSIYIHPTSKKSLDALFGQAPHAALITGAAGIGLATIAQHYASISGKTVVTVLPEKDEKIDIEKGSITVDSIRRLYDLTKTIDTTGRVIIIDYAERMGVPAQNAFLKLLEEPTQGTQFILLSHTPESLLPTIRSRSQHVNVRAITLEQSHELLDTLGVGDATKRTQLLFIAKGLPAELTRLVHDEAHFASRAEIIKDAREFMTGSAYKRLMVAKKYKESRSQALILLEDAIKQLEQAIAQGGRDDMVRVLARLETLHRRLYGQGNVRLQLSSAVLL